ncbi:MAG: creatininase family protein [Alphaproteobacteria bacterium]|jgi:creatinine amidohydrolase|nr:creatininase family protein [Alphaproteobacteria bacterium]
MQQVEWAKCKAHELRRLAAADAVVIVPVASIEQHGPHLPVQVDTRLAYETSRRSARLVAERGGAAVVTPPVWSGLSEHHIPFGGTLSVDYQTFFLILRGITDSLVRQGFRRILINNGHGGNITACKMAVQELTLEFELPVVATTYPIEARQAFAEILEDQDFIMHAGEAETSMMLALVPDLVDASDLGACAGTSAGSLGGPETAYRWHSFSERTANGVIGDPTRASAEKGEKLLDASAEGLAKLILAPETWARGEDVRLPETGGVPLKDS